MRVVFDRLLGLSLTSPPAGWLPVDWLSERRGHLFNPWAQDIERPSVQPRAQDKTFYELAPGRVAANFV